MLYLVLWQTQAQCGNAVHAVLIPTFRGVPPRA